MKVKELIQSDKYNANTEIQIYSSDYPTSIIAMFRLFRDVQIIVDDAFKLNDDEIVKMIGDIIIEKLTEDKT